MADGDSAHGKDTEYTIGGDDISEFTKTSTFEMNPDIHDITGYGKNSKVKRGGLKDNSFTASGWYAIGPSGPGAILRPLTGQTVVCTRKPEGTGAGLPLQTFDAVVGKYVETNPVDDIVTWSCDFAVSDDVVESVQV